MMKNKGGKILMLGTLSLLTACVPFKKLENESDIHNKIGGSWTVMHDGHKKIERITPPAFIEFNENNNGISGFDGCNKFNGTYRVDSGVLKASIKSSRMACSNAITKEVSNNMQTLLKDGAQVVSIELMGAKAILLANKDKNVELRFGNTEQLNKDMNE